MAKPRRNDPDVTVTPSEVQGEVLFLDEPLLGYSQVEFTGHAVERLMERKFSREDVLKTIRKPTKTGLDTKEGRCRVRRNITARVALDVVYEVLHEQER